MKDFNVFKESNEIIENMIKKVEGQQINNEELPISLKKKKMKAELKQMKSSVQTTQGQYGK